MGKQRSVVFLIVIAALALGARSGQAAAQSAGKDPAPPIYIPQGHPVYGTLELFRGAGLLADVALDRRPLSRHVVARALQAGIERARERGLEMLARTGEWRLRDFPEASEDDPNAPDPRPGLLGVRWQNEDISLTGELSFEIAYDARTDLPPDYKKAWIGRSGFEIYGTIGDRVGFAGRYRQSTEKREGSIRDAPFAPVQTIPGGNRGHTGERVYSESNGHISWQGKHFGFDFRFDSPAWGPSPARNLLFSGHVPNFAHAVGRIGIGGWLHYTVLAGQLRSGIIDTTRSYPSDIPRSERQLERAKYLIAHRLEIRPLPRFQIGLCEAVIAGDRFPEMLYLVPTISVWEVQHYLNDPDNTMISLDLNWSPVKGPRLYGAIALDEWHIGATFSENESHNWMAFQIGADWTLPLAGGRYHLWLEASRVNPNVYRHKFAVNDWTHSSSLLGFWSGQNAEVVQGELSCQVSPPLQIGLWSRYARKGGIVSREEQYTIPPSEDFLLGPIRLGSWVGARVRFEGKHNWLVNAEVVRAPEALWPHNRDSTTLPAMLDREWHYSLRWAYNLF